MQYHRQAPPEVGNDSSESFGLNIYWPLLSRATLNQHNHIADSGSWMPAFSISRLQAVQWALRA